MMKVFRVFVEKKKGFDLEAKQKLDEIHSILGVTGLENLRLFNRYDVQGIDEQLFEKCKTTVFSEVQTDDVYDDLSLGADYVFALEYLPGQFDQRADSCSQCIQIVSMGERPTVRTAKIFALYGKLSAGDIERIKNDVINPVESREASLERVQTLDTEYDIPKDVKVLDDFNSLDKDALKAFIDDYALAMDIDDISFCQDYFKKEDRAPTITEIRMIDTYWSDHCRHTTFSTNIDDVSIEDIRVEKAYGDYIKIRKELSRTKPITLMDLGTIGAKYLVKTGELKNLDESEEINACTVKIDVDVDGETEKWLFLFKNETHNHPTEIEPFGGAATCIGGAIRDPLSGRSYVYQAMRVTGAANPLVSVQDTLKGKLPQRKIVTTAAEGYSSYGNQIGLATGLVDEIYHEGYVAKRMEIGAVVGAAPAKNVRREVPEDGDLVILLGGRTGRDGCGGATGSSKSHSSDSLAQCGAEVQKGNAPEERKIQRLFRNGEVTRLIKRCNDFGAGGVSVAIGELADGLQIDLDKVPKKYDGLDGTELAISESQERMAVVVSKSDAQEFIQKSNEENLEATIVAHVTAEKRLRMTWRGKEIVNISREFLNSNGAPKHINVKVKKGEFEQKHENKPFTQKIKELAADLNICSKRGLTERFDSTIGAGTVLMPLGGKKQATPIQTMVAKIPVEKGETKTCSAMAYGYNPFIMEKDPFLGAYLAVVESVTKLVASGAGLKSSYLTFQEYFERLGTDAYRWGKPFAALLGALKAQKELGIGAIGGKDSMSGTFENIDVPPTLVSFAVSIGNTDNIISPEFKKAGSAICLASPESDNMFANAASIKKMYSDVCTLIEQGKIISAWAVAHGGIAEGLVKMSLGNEIGVKIKEDMDEQKLFNHLYGSIILEMAQSEVYGEVIGETTKNYTLCYKKDEIDLADIEKAYNDKLESVYPVKTKAQGVVESYSHQASQRKAPAVAVALPKVLIPVFPGTNCEYDTARAFENAGAKAEIVVIKNILPGDIEQSAKKVSELISASQIIALPGGFSGGDEPDGSGKFITAFFRNPRVKDSVHELLKNRDGLMCGICNGFQALVKLGLIEHGEIIDPDENSPTLTFNIIGRHQSRLYRTRVASNKSPWLMGSNVGDIHTVAISHGEGRFIANDDVMKKLIENAQLATQYVDLEGNASMDVDFNPNGSFAAAEGVTSPDGRIFGKMGHSERKGDNLYKNVCGEKENNMFKNAVKYFKVL